MALSSKMKKKMEARKKEVSSKGGGAKGMIFFKQGKTRIRILPVGERDFAQEGIRFFLGKDLGEIISPATFGEPCAIYDKHQELKKGDDDDKALADTFKPSRRFYAPALKFKDHNDKTSIDKEVGVGLAILTNGIYLEMVELMLDDEAGDFTDAKEGYDIKISREGEGMLDTTYKAIACKPTKLPKEYAKKEYDPEEMLREKMATYEETEEVLASFLGTGKKKKKGSKEDRIAEKKAAMKKKKKKKVSDA